MNCHLSVRCFSNGLQRYGLFFNLQIFLQYFCKNFYIFLRNIHKSTENQQISNATTLQNIANQTLTHYACCTNTAGIIINLLIYSNLRDTAETFVEFSDIILIFVFR